MTFDEEGPWINSQSINTKPWKVWFAWHPIIIRRVGVRRYPVESVMDLEVRQWRWLCNVARRRFHVGASYWEYAPAHKALTQ